MGALQNADMTRKVLRLLVLRNYDGGLQDCENWPFAYIPLLDF
jgi:hypothetical protein